MTERTVSKHTIELVVNGSQYEVHITPGATLLDLIRNGLGLVGTKSACGRGECGACTVLIDGSPVMSCVTLAETVSSEVTTIEGAAASATTLRRSFADSGAFQCGYCTPGQIIRAMALLDEDSDLSEQDVRESISGNICRCTGYDPIVQAILRPMSPIEGVL